MAADPQGVAHRNIAATIPPAPRTHVTLSQLSPTEPDRRDNGRDTLISEDIELYPQAARVGCGGKDVDEPSGSSSTNVSPMAGCRGLPMPHVMTVPMRLSAMPPPVAVQYYVAAGGNECTAVGHGNGRRAHTAGLYPSSDNCGDGLPAQVDASSSDAEVASVCVGTEEEDACRFWRSTVSRLYALYVERRLSLCVRLLAQLEAGHWRRLFAFAACALRFVTGHDDELAAATEKAQHGLGGSCPQPPTPPAELLAYLLRAYATGAVISEQKTATNSASNDSDVVTAGADTATAPPTAATPPSLLPSPSLDRGNTMETAWYLEGMLLLRLLMRRGPGHGDATTGLRMPPRIIQFLVGLVSSEAASAYLLTAGALWPEVGGCDGSEQLLRALREAGVRHGGDVVLACQQLLSRLYPHDEGGGSGAQGRRGPVQPEEIPTFGAVMMSTAFHLSSMLIAVNMQQADSRVDSADATAVPNAHESDGKDDADGIGGTLSEGVGDPSEDGSASNGYGGESMPTGTASPVRPAGGTGRTPYFTRLLDRIWSKGSATQASLSDRFLLSLRDVLVDLLGPAPAEPEDLPEPVEPLSPPTAASDGASGDIRVVARIVRTLLQVQFTNPVLLDAREDFQYSLQNTNVAKASSSPVSAGSDDGGNTSDGGIVAGVGRSVDSTAPVSGAVAASATPVFATAPSAACVGPSEPGDYVLGSNRGPLRRTLAFMEHSALLEVVQGRLCAATFQDVVGSSKQLSAFALRNIRVLWFDLRLCTCTLKRDPLVEGAATALPALLVLRNLRLRLAHDWEATLATFPYLSLGGGSQVSVRKLAISIHVRFHPRDGVFFPSVDVEPPEVEVSLSCSSVLSQVALQVVLSAVLQASLQALLQDKLQHLLTRLLQAEGARWNESFWKPIAKVVPSSIISQLVSWLRSQLPREGLPI
eukprot:TRINITY_DN32372_c0_g1_i1.p1 TRINITY_DN32372_c0_g1~~TRINITY_DN32372_c0_g1_i1.p1  ORF type:complete len:930 (-),score=166.19 TRINITY_DN32372_c0_g1_i1:213-3002(-)